MPGGLLSCGCLYVREKEKSDQVCGFFFEKKLSSRTFISLFCNIDIVFTIHHTSLNRDMSEVSLLITAFGSQNKVPHSNDMVVVSEA